MRLLHADQWTDHPHAHQITKFVPNLLLIQGQPSSSPKFELQALQSCFLVKFNTLIINVLQKARKQTKNDMFGPIF